MLDQIRRASKWAFAISGWPVIHGGTVKLASSVDCSFHKTMVRALGILSSTEEDDALDFLG
jgi:hypothetical protein